MTGAEYTPETGGMVAAVVTVTAIGSTDAQDQAKRVVRADGYRVRGVRSLRLVSCPGDEHRCVGVWTVTLGVRPGASA